MFDLVRASILFKVEGDEPLNSFIRDINEGFESVKSDESSRLVSFFVAASEMSRQIEVNIELRVPVHSEREIEDDVTALIHRALNYSGHFNWGADDGSGRVRLDQGLSQYAYA